MESLKIQLDKNNKEQQMAFDLVKKTNKSLFITGKAGTGKTTFIKLIQGKINKNFLLLAPTGIAAVKVGGQTMHSFFGFPMQAIGPHTEIKLSQDNEALLREVDTIIVDEASMVRSDMVDGMAENYFDNKLRDANVNVQRRPKTRENFDRLPETFTIEDVMRCFNLSNASARKRTIRLVCDHLVVKIREERGSIQAVFRKTGVVML